MTVLIQKVLIVTIIVTSFFLTSQGSEAGVREDFIQAHKNLKEGKLPCETIPYSNLVAKCVEQRKVIEDNCKTVQYRCDNEMKEFHDPKPIMIQRKKHLERLKELEYDTTQKSNNLRELENRPPPRDESAIAKVKESMKSNERETQDLKRAVEELDREIVVRKDKIDKRIAWAKQCIDSRQEQQKVFQTTSSQAKSESAEGFTKERDELVNVWDTSIRDHEPPKDQIRRSITTCEEIRDYRP